jgi:hypothetical protein
LPRATAVSYNGGGADWVLNQNQLLNSVGSGATTSAITGTSCQIGQQSPINVVDDVKADGTPATKSAVYNASLTPLDYDYPATSTYKVEMNGAAP